MSPTLLAIDPGPVQSAWLVLSHGRPTEFGIEPNDELLAHLRTWVPYVDAVVIENIEPRYGQQTGWETLNTARWVGRFQEAAQPVPVELLTRSGILKHLGVMVRGASADAGVRAALIDRFGGSESIRKGGVLYGVKSHIWAALSVAVAYVDGLR